MDEIQSAVNQLIDSYVIDFDSTDAHGYVSYQKLLEPMFVLDAECKRPFESSSRTYMLKDLIFASSIANTSHARLTRSANHESAIGSDFIVVLFYRDFPIRIRTDQHTVEVEPEQIVFADLSKPLTIETSGINVLSVNFSRNLLNALVPLTEQMHGNVFREGPHKELLVAYMKSLEQVAAQILTKDSIHVTETIVRLVANCVLQNKESIKLNVTGNQKVSLLQLKQAIDAQIEDPRLGPETLIAQFHVSRASNYRMFEPLGGVAKYIQNRKLDYAFHQLAKYSEKKHNISMLAYRLGFSQVSVFTRAFQSRFEMSPSEVRAKVGKKEKQPLPWELEIDLTQYIRNKPSQ